MAIKRLAFVVVAGMLALSACTATVTTGHPATTDTTTPTAITIGTEQVPASRG